MTVGSFANDHPYDNQNHCAVPFDIIASFAFCLGALNADLTGVLPMQIVIFVSLLLMAWI